MDHIDLTISTGYVPGWRFWEGARELIQNAFDRERETDEGCDPVQRVMSEYRSSISHDESVEEMVVENADTIIPRNTLLLGQGSKTAGGNTIGQHGEGYKLALLALTRCGRTVVVENGPERWVPEIVDSEFLGVKVLRINFEEGDPSNTALRFTVSNVSPEDWAAVVCNIRRLHDSGEEWRGENGRMLPSEVEMGRLYVGGLFVQELRTRYLYGYDFDPAHLDRDRQKVSSFDLNWEIGKLLASLGLEAERYVMGAMKATSEEVEHLLRNSGPMLDRVNEVTYEEFRTEHGDHAFPVDTEYRAQDVRLNHPGVVKPVIVDPVTMQAINAAPKYREWVVQLPTADRKDPGTVLRDFLEQHMEYFPQTLADAFATEIIDRAEVEGWTI